jgi:hypothetical protein
LSRSTFERSSIFLCLLNPVKLVVILVVVVLMTLPPAIASPAEPTVD